MRKLIFISAILCLAFLFAGCTNENKKAENNDVSSSVQNGDNSVTAKPSGEIIEVSDEDGLFAMANDLTATYVIKNDITLTKTWKTIGTENAPFVGTLDGGGFTIHNMAISSDAIAPDGTSINYMVGMFGVLSGTLKNLSIDSVTVSVNASSIAKTSYQSLLTANPSVTDLDIHVGIAGLNKGNIRNVTANINYIVNPDCEIARVRIGGIAGKSNDEITDCTVNGDIRIQNSNGYIRAGGIAGYVSSNGILQSSRANINISADITGEAKMNLGGLIGNIECGIVTGCISTGSVTGNGSDGKATIAGGLIGLIDNTDTKYEDMSVTVTDSYSTATVIVSGAKSYAAGFIGQIDFNNTVNISSNSCSGAASGDKGSFGFLGRIQTALGEQLYSSDFSSGSYNNTVAIKNNRSVIGDAFATKVSEIILPD